MDVKALHKDIPNNEGIAAVKRKHNNYTKTKKGFPYSQALRIKRIC